MEFVFVEFLKRLVLKKMFVCLLFFKVLFYLLFSSSVQWLKLECLLWFSFDVSCFSCCCFLF